MRIVADSGILSLKSYLDSVADLRLLPGREISRADLVEADALLVRSITKVDQQLLHGTAVKFVGSATSGTDHVDLEYLRSRNIGFADARGSNANAVVDYCFAALAYASLRRNLQLNKCRVGLLGAGHVGGLFARKLAALGIDYLVCDPPLQMQKQISGSLPASKFGSLAELLQCDVISLHVPLIRDGGHPTHYLIGERELSAVKPDFTLINTCRGAVVHEPALLEKLQRSPDATCIMDVWENEPQVSAELVSLVDIATPHIAGYSQDAKQAATTQMLASLARYFELPDPATQQHLPAAEFVDTTITATSGSAWQHILDLLPLEKLSEEFKNSVRTANVAIEFDAMRKRLLGRREFKYHRLSGLHCTAGEMRMLQTLGLQLP